MEDGHTSATCPRDWQTPGHQEGCNRQNVQQYITAGHNALLKGQHKNQLPAGFRQVGAEIYVADKLNRALVLSPTPTQINNTQMNVENDIIKIIASNTTKTVKT